MRTNWGLLILLFALVATTQVNARTFIANDFASYKAAVDVIFSNNSGEDTIRVTGNILTEQSGLGINGDLTIIGDTNPDGTPKYTMDFSGGGNIYCAPQNYCTIQNVIVTNAGHGMEVYMGTDNCRIKIDNCVIFNNNDYGMYVHANTSGAATPYQQNISITNCTCTNNRDGIYVDAMVQNSKDFVIDNCRCNNNSNSGIALGSVDNISISNCVTNENGDQGIDASYYPNNITIDNCLADGNEGDGFRIGISNSDKKGIINNSIATNNLGNGFNANHSVLTGCTADKNGKNGFYGNADQIIFDKCLATNNGALGIAGYYDNSGFNTSWGGVVINSTATNNVGAGFYTAGGACVINSTFSNNLIGIRDDRGGAYNSIAYGNNIDIKVSDNAAGLVENIYNTVYATIASAYPDNYSAINCSDGNPQLQGKTASGEDTNSPDQTVCYALGAGSSALGFADKSLVTAGNIIASFPSFFDSTDRGWYSDIFTQDYVDNIPVYDQRGCVRSFVGNKYDAGAISGNFCGAADIKEVDEPQAVLLTPNPAQTDCTIAFDVEKPGNSRIKLFTMLGTEAMNIYDGYTASGRFEHTFNIGSLSTGVYVVQINANGKVMVAKLLVAPHSH